MRQFWVVPAKSKPNFPLKDGTKNQTTAQEKRYGCFHSAHYEGNPPSSQTLADRRAVPRAPSKPKVQPV
jgi:hypothetical protein